MASDERSGEGVDLSRAIYQAFGITAEEVEEFDPSSDRDGVVAGVPRAAPNRTRQPTP